jgi:hypothetical protein
MNQCLRTCWSELLPDPITYPTLLDDALALSDLFEHPLPLKARRDGVAGP